MRNPAWNPMPQEFELDYRATRELPPSHLCNASPVMQWDRQEGSLHHARFRRQFRFTPGRHLQFAYPGQSTHYITTIYEIPTVCRTLHRKVSNWRLTQRLNLPFTISSTSKIKNKRNGSRSISHFCSRDVWLLSLQSVIFHFSHLFWLTEKSLSLQERLED